MHVTKIDCKAGSLLYNKRSVNLGTCRNAERSEDSPFFNFVQNIAKLNRAIGHSEGLFRRLATKSDGMFLEEK